MLTRGENLDHIQILGSLFIDHYDPRLKNVSLVMGTWVSESIWVVCASSHEVAHAIQFRSAIAVLMQKSLWVIGLISYATQKTMCFRKRLIPVVFLGAIAGFTPFVALGMFWSLIPLGMLASMAIEVVIEIWARSIAPGLLQQYDLVYFDEEQGIRELTLSWVKTRIFFADLFDTIMDEMMERSIVTLLYLLGKKINRSDRK